MAVSSVTHSRVLANFETLFTGKTIVALGYLKIGKLTQAKKLLAEVTLLNAYYTLLESYNPALSDEDNWFTSTEYDQIITVLENMFNKCNLKQGSYSCNPVEETGGAVYQDLEFIYFQDGNRMEYN